MEAQTVGLLLLLCFVGWSGVRGHGRLILPAMRSSIWRINSSFPKNYNDNELNCGGRYYQHEKHGGKCGICGDPYNETRENEANGKYALGFIVKYYATGELIRVTIDLTANHKGFFEFRLCPNNNVTKVVEQSCLDRYLLRIKEADNQTRFDAKTVNDSKVTMAVHLPQGLTCHQCVLQWKYTTGNSWGTDPVTGKSCVGCGDQEQFINCADIAIADRRLENAREESTSLHPLKPTKKAAPGGSTTWHPSKPTKKVVPGGSTTWHPSKPTKKVVHGVSTTWHPSKPTKKVVPGGSTTWHPSKPTKKVVPGGSTTWHPSKPTKKAAPGGSTTWHPSKPTKKAAPGGSTTWHPSKPTKKVVPGGSTTWHPSKPTKKVVPGGSTTWHPSKPTKKVVPGGSTTWHPSKPTKKVVHGVSTTWHPSKPTKKAAPGGSTSLHPPKPRKVFPAASRTSNLMKNTRKFAARLLSTTYHYEPKDGFDSVPEFPFPYWD